MIDVRFLERLLELLNSSSAGSIEVRKHLFGTTIRVSKDAGVPASGPVTYQVAAPQAPAPVPGAPPVPAVPENPAPAPVAPPEPVQEVKLTEVKSPMVGTFYAQPEPGAEPYVQVGSRIKPGQTLCIIEAMKIMNPIDAEVSGLIKEIAVQDAQPVEFGQVLFRVDPNG
jgi:acetyl-CoA carboxylase biotin carboxyl carrier protein